MKPVTLFVYGTLLSGFNNHYLLKGARFLGTDEAPGIMYGGGAPVTTPTSDNTRWVKGEVYEITDERMMARLDGLEGHPTAYTRTPVTLRSGRSAEIYYWLRKVFKSDHIEDGDYRRYRTEEEARWKAMTRLRRGA